MEAENLADDIVVFKFHQEPRLREDLTEVVDIISSRDKGDVIFDFAEVELITSPSLASLLQLRRVQVNNGHRLILCDVNHLTRGVLAVTGLDRLFEVADDISQGWHLLQRTGLAG